MTPQQEIDIYLTKTSMNDKMLVDLYLAKPIEQTLPNNDTVADVNDLAPQLLPATAQSTTNSNPVKEEENLPHTVMENQPSEIFSSLSVPADASYKIRFYIAIGLSIILFGLLILKKYNA